LYKKEILLLVTYIVHVASDCVKVYKRHLLEFFKGQTFYITIGFNFILA
jgi:hypothetical protein